MFELLKKRKWIIIGIFCLASYAFAPLYFDRHQLDGSREQWHCNKRNVPGDPKLTIRPTTSMKLVRLSNLGEFVDRCELADVLYELNWGRNQQVDRAPAKFDPLAPKLPKLAILYVHGWKHSADKEDDDFVKFTELVERLRERHKGEKHVVGVYVSWNASADLYEPFESLSFWVKKNNADRISQSNAVTMIVSSIGSVVSRGTSDQFIAIGHSFGARMLFSATAQSLITQAKYAHPGYNGGEYRPFKGTADAVILLNPAFEASRYTPIDDFTRSGEKFPPTQKPVLVSISSEADWATSYAFPVGQWLDWANTKRERTTLGNYRPYRSHTLEISDGTDCGTPDILSENFYKVGLCLKRVRREVTEPLRSDERNRIRKSKHPYNPFIVATTSSVILGHNDVWNESFRGWMFELISALEDRPQPSNSTEQPDIPLGKTETSGMQFDGASGRN